MRTPPQADLTQLLEHRDLAGIIGFIGDALSICDCAGGCPTCSRGTPVSAEPQPHPIEPLLERLRAARTDLICIHGDDRYGDVEREVAGIDVRDADLLIELLGRVITQAA